MDDRERIETAIAAQSALRGIVPDDVVDAAITALVRQLGDEERSQRRQITALFADVSGFTAMSEALDPELVSDRMNALWLRLDTLITDFGGHIDKHMGDAVMALWGSTVAREDDVERAVRAGLALQDAVIDHRRVTGDEMAMRVGINTGRAMVTTIGTTAERTAMGDTVNLASRLEHAAPVGAVLISEQTYRHVRGVFDVEALPPMEIRGKAQPVQAFVVRRAKPRAFRIPSRGIEGVETPTIGRSSEIARLRASYEAVAAGGGAQVVVIVGEAGVGKSRLLFELQTWLELRPEDVWLFHGRSLPGSESIPLGLVRDVVAQRFGVLDSDEPATVLAKVRSGFDGFLVADEADVVARWLGFGIGEFEWTGDGLASSARALFIRWIAALAGDGPIALLLEDLHWADAESLAFVREVVERLYEAPLLVVGPTRPELLDRDRTLLESSVPVDVIELEPLTPDTAAALVMALLALCHDVPPHFVDLVARRSDGNPFFAEEVIKMFIDDGVIRTDGPDGRWRIDAGRVQSDSVPATLNDVLQIRLDLLPPVERVALQCASVLGRIFWDRAVRALDDEPDTGAALDAPAGRELIYRHDPSSIDGCVEFIFKHALLRDVTYETVLLRDRQRLHGRAAAWLTAQIADRLEEYGETIAEHHRLAGELDAAAAFLERSGRLALDRGLTTAAKRSFEQAVALWRDAGLEPTVKALVGLADAYSRAGETDAAAATADVALTRASAPEDVLEALLIGRRLAADRGQVDRDRALTEQALSIVDPGDRFSLATWQVRLGHWHLQHGDLDEAERLGVEALEATQDVASTELRCTALILLGFIALARDTIDDAVDHMTSAVDVADAGVDLSAQAITRGELAVALHIRGDRSGSVQDHRAAIDNYERSLAFRAEMGERRGSATTRANLAQALLRVGDLDAARPILRQALEEAVNGKVMFELFVALLVEADRCLVDVDLDRGLRILGAVAAHPASGRGDQLEIERILATTTLDRAMIDAGMAVGASDDFDSLVADVLSVARQAERR